MKTLPLSLCAGLLLTGLAAQSQADILVNSDFDAGYTLGDLTGQSGTNDVGFTGVFQATSGEFGGSVPTQTVVTGGLTYSNGSVFIPGGNQSVQVTSTYAFTQSQSLIRAIGGNLTGETFYFRAVINAPAVDDLMLGFGNNSGDLGNAGVGVIDSTNNGGTAVGQLPRFYNNGGGGFQNPRADSGVALPAGNNLLVAEFVFSAGEYRTVNFFLDPTSITQGTPTATFSIPAGSDGTTDLGETLSLLTTNNQTTYGIDSIALGTDYSDVVTGVPEPGTWTLVGISGIFTVAYLMRRRQIA